MKLTKTELQGTSFNGVLASVWEYNKKTKEFLFSNNSLLMFGLIGVLKEEKWYSQKDELYKHVFGNQVENNDALISFLDNFNSETVVDFGMNLVFKSNGTEFYLEGFCKKDIVNITAIETEASK